MLILRPYSALSTWLAMELIAGRTVVIKDITPPEKPDPKDLTTFQLLDELERRHKAFVFAGVTKDGEVEFDYSGEPLELYGLAKVAKKRANAAADAILDGDLEDDEDDEDLDDEPEGTAESLPPSLRWMRGGIDPVKEAAFYLTNMRLSMPEPKAPAPPAPKVVSVEKRCADMPADVTHVVLQDMKLGEPIPEFIEYQEGWRKAVGPGTAWGNDRPSNFRRGRRAEPHEIPTPHAPPVKLIELTEENRDPRTPPDVTHVVEVPYPTEDGVEPMFYLGDFSGWWRMNPYVGMKCCSGSDIRHARAATPDEIRASKPAKRPDFLIIDEPTSPAPKVGPRPLVSTNVPRLPYFPSTGRSFRLW